MQYSLVSSPLLFFNISSSPWKKLLLFFFSFAFIFSGNAQIYLSDNGLTASGSGTSKKVSLGGTLNNAQTAIDFGSSNSSSNLLIKKGSSNYLYVGNNGRVGVGTTTTPEQLVIGGGTAGNEILIGSRISADGYNHISLNGSTNTNDYNFASKNTDGNLFINTPRDHFTYIGSNDEPKISIAPWGAIAIQRYPWYSPPLYMLDIMAWGPNDGLNLETANPGFVRLLASHVDSAKYNPLVKSQDGGLFYGNKINDDSNNPGAPSFGFVLAPWSNSAVGLRMDATGNIGINKSTPTAPLDVNGNIKATGLILPTGAGVNKILTSDASGNASWQLASSITSSSTWALTGNSGTAAATNFVGTTDSVNLVFRTNNKQQASIFADGTFNISSTDTASKPAFRVYPNGDFAFNATNDYTFGKYENKSGIRYNSKLGILEIGLSNNIDTTVPRLTGGIYEKSGLIINSDTRNTIRTPRFMVSALIADNTLLDSTMNLSYSIISGESHVFRTAPVTKSFISGYGHGITGGLYGTIIGGQSNSCTKPIANSIITGYANSTADSTGGSLVVGYFHSYGGIQQFVSGNQLVNKTPMGTTLGNQNVDFASLSYPGYSKGQTMTGITNLDKYPIFSIGNSRYAYNSGIRSNAVTVLYNGRTQINTTGYTNNLSETDVTPKAAFEVVSTNSGILLPKLTATQRDAIAPSDLQNGLLLYNTTAAQFQYYDGSVWKSIGEGGSAAAIGGWSTTGNTGSNPSTAFIGTTDNQPLLFKVNNNEAIRIAENGNVGIGTATPGDYKLGVNGIIHAKKVRVDQEGWSDYVFENDYALPTLQQVQAFIKVHKHLPGVLSAEEVKENGIDLGENQSVLLKKIEELTLYAIEQERRIEEQNKKMEQQQQQIDELIKVIKKN